MKDMKIVCLHRNARPYDRIKAVAKFYYKDYEISCTTDGQPEIAVFHKDETKIIYQTYDTSGEGLRKALAYCDLHSE